MKKLLLALGLASLGIMALPACGLSIHHGYGGYGGGVGGGKPCETCNDYLADGTGPLCAGEDETNYAELVNCLCNGPCAGACAGDLFCNPTGDQLSSCDSCLQQNSGCAIELNTCTASNVPPCVPCADYLASPTGVICPGSDMIYDELTNCLCNGPCAKACAGDAYCTPDGTALGECDSCMQESSGCDQEFTECANDH